MAFQMAAAIALGIFHFLFALETHNKNQYKLCARDTHRLFGWKVESFSITWAPAAV